MVKKGYFLVGILLSLYLFLPGPKLPPADLPEALKSDEPGDTYQLTQVSAYYTRKSREEVVSFYTDYFSHSSFLNLPLFTYRLNHPPEYAREVWIDTKRSYYLEEIIHPFSGSLFVNGFEWEKDVFTPPGARAQNVMIVGGETWPSKVSLRWFPSHFLPRLVIFWATWVALGSLFIFWKRELVGTLPLLLKAFFKRRK